jgi:predicted permease
MAQINELLQVIFDTIAPMFLIIGASVLVGKYRAINAQSLSRISIYLMSPALILANISRSGMGADELTLILVASIVLLLFMVFVGSTLARFFRFERKIASSFALAAFIMNSVTFGLPFIEFALGPEGLETAVVFAVGQVLIGYLFGTYIASRGNSSPKAAIRNVLTIPMPYAFAIGLWLNHTGYHIFPPVEKAISVLSEGLVPVTLILLGLQLGSVKFGGQWKPIALATLMRYGIGAAAAFAVAALFGLQGISRQAFILEASMPAGILSGVLSTEFGGDPEFASAVILVTTLASALFLSGLLLILK